VIDRRQTDTDRQTDHGMEKYVGVGEIACALNFSKRFRLKCSTKKKSCRL